MSMDGEETFFKGLAVVGVCFAAFLVGLLCMMIRGCWTSDSGKVDYCYINVTTGTAGQTVHTLDNPLYDLHGHVQWNNDQYIGVFSTFDQAVEAAKKIDCPLHSN